MAPKKQPPIARLIALERAVAENEARNAKRFADLEPKRSPEPQSHRPDGAKCQDPHCSQRTAFDCPSTPPAASDLCPLTLEEKYHRQKRDLVSIRLLCKQALPHLLPSMGVPTIIMVQALSEKLHEAFERVRNADEARKCVEEKLAAVTEAAQAAACVCEPCDPTLSADGEPVPIGAEVRIARASGHSCPHVGRIGTVAWKGVSNGTYYPRGVPLVRVESLRLRAYVPTRFVRVIS